MGRLTISVFFSFLAKLLKSSCSILEDFTFLIVFSAFESVVSFSNSADPDLFFLTDLILVELSNDFLLEDFIKAPSSGSDDCFSVGFPVAGTSWSTLNTNIRMITNI